MSRSAVFRVYLSRPSSVPMTIDYTTVPGTASSPTDFTSTSGQITFNPGQTVSQIVVPVRDDIPGDPEKQFSISLNNPSNVSLSKSSAVCVLPGTDINSQPYVSVDNVTVASAT